MGRIVPFMMLLAAAGSVGTGCTASTSTSTCTPGVNCPGGDTSDAASSSDTTASDTASTDTATADTAAPICEPVEPPCTDNQILDLALFKQASDRGIDNVADGNGFVSTIDSSGGGSSPSEAYVYAKFTDKGLVKVDIGDEKAFASQDWDIAARRFIIRLNSGVAGPSCVGAYKLSSANKFDDVAAVPDTAVFKPEAYYDSKCQVVPDKSGLGTPATQLATFWKYTNCVKMTGTVYVLQLANGRHVKLSVVTYYQPEVQAKCDSGSAIPAGSEGGNLGLRWAYLD